MTVRGFDAELEKAIRDLAESEGISLNRAALELLRRGAGLDTENPPKDRIGDSQNHLWGHWTEEDAQEFEEAIKEFDRIDEEMWR